MQWLNLRTSVLHAPEFIGCDPTRRATWLAVLLWSVEQENGGRIPGAARWSDRRWQQTAGVTLQEVQAAAPLLVLDGSDLTIWSYPSEQEEIVRTKRAIAIRNGQLGGRPPKAPPEEKPTSEPMSVSRSEPTLEPTSEPISEPTSESVMIMVRERKDIAPAPPFASEAFGSAWRDWLAYRAERKVKPYKPTGLQAAFTRLATMGEPRAVAAIRYSMAQNWQGIFEEKPNANRPITNPRNVTGGQSYAGVTSH